DMFANAVLGAALQPDQEALMLAHQISFTGMEDVALFTAEITAGLTEEEIEEMGGLPGGYGLGDVEEGQVPPQSHEPAVTVLKNGVASSQWGGQLDDRGQPLARAIALPSDINHHPRWAMAAVAGKASDTVVLFNTAEADPMQHVLAVIATQSAPVAVAFSEDGRYLYVQHSNQFTVGVVDVWELLGADTTGQFRARTTSVPISYTALPKAVVYGVDPMSETERAGRRAFTFTRTDGLSQGGAMSCEMCHIEGTEDGLVWFTNDGPRQTPLLADRVPGTEPFNWVGSEAGIVDNMVETVERMGGEGLDSAMMDSIEGFMHLMPGPTLADAHQSRALNALEQEGQALFFDATVGCGSCHSGTHTTDGKNYDVGTSTWVEQELQNIRASFGQIDSVDPPLYNTPSLKGLRYTSPYLHDGSASTLMEVLERTATTMGRTDHLTTRQRQALVAYLLTL
ncbi:MAG: c-type cytochrome, partial [Myxococcota bacterium]